MMRLLLRPDRFVFSPGEFTSKGGWAGVKVATASEVGYQSARYQPGGYYGRTVGRSRGTGKDTRLDREEIKPYQYTSQFV
jgi:hypothetical protein